MAYYLEDQIKNLIEDGFFSSEHNLKEFITKDGLDLPYGNKVYHIANATLPFNRTTKDILKEQKIEEYSTASEPTLIKGQTYLIPTIKIVKELPAHLLGETSGVSSMGRLFDHVKAFVDYAGRYEKILPGSKGTIWIEVTPKTFNTKLPEVLALNNLRINDTTCTKEVESLKEEKVLYDKDQNQLTNQKYFDKNQVIMGINLQDNDANGNIGFEARNTDKVVYLKPEHNNWEYFFKPIKPTEKFEFEKGKDYIFATSEFIRIAEGYLGEMAHSSDEFGNFRAHYAAFFGPLFGDNKGNRAVMEITAMENHTFVHGQPICKVRFHKTIANLANGYAGKYNRQEIATPGKFFDYKADK